jgi:hypothetical protein
MVLMAEHLPGVDANPFEDSIPVQESVVINADDCLFFGNELAVEINELRHGMGPPGSNKKSETNAKFK